MHDCFGSFSALRTHPSKEAAHPAIAFLAREIDGGPRKVRDGSGIESRQSHWERCKPYIRKRKDEGRDSKARPFPRYLQQSEPWVFALADRAKNFPLLPNERKMPLVFSC